MRGWAIVGGCGVCALLTACHLFGGSCTDMACVGKPTKLQLVDAEGQAVAAAKGEVRDAQGTHPFDCTDAPQDFPSEYHCSEGTLTLRPLYTNDVAHDVRFVRDDGSFSDWQPVAITATKHTDNDFNGPDCPCSWFEGKAKPLLVPEDARNPLPQPLLNLGGASADP